MKTSRLLSLFIVTAACCFVPLVGGTAIAAAGPPMSAVVLATVDPGAGSGVEGNGGTLTTTDAGGSYPVTSLSHMYLAAGQNTVSLPTNWTGTFSMAGGPPIVIPGGAIPRASAPFVLDIHEARGVLVTS